VREVLRGRTAYGEGKRRFARKNLGKTMNSGRGEGIRSPIDAEQAGGLGAAARRPAGLR
jgi:hypothetical protein